jgi:hypothetical protein
VLYPHPAAALCVEASGKTNVRLCVQRTLVKVPKPRVLRKGPVACTNCCCVIARALCRCPAPLVCRSQGPSRLQQAAVGKGRRRAGQVHASGPQDPNPAVDDNGVQRYRSSSSAAQSLAVRSLLDTGQRLRASDTWGPAAHRGVSSFLPSTQTSTLCPHPVLTTGHDVKSSTAEKPGTNGCPRTWAALRISASGALHTLQNISA